MDEWQYVSKDLFPHLQGTPGLQYDAKRDQLKIHRTHTPLLPEYTVLRSACNRLVLDNETKKNGWTLRPYQHEAREFVLSRRGTLLALGLRMGKTVTACASHQMSEGKFFVVAPLAVRDVWLTWIKKVWPQCKIAILEGIKIDNRLHRADAIIAHYDILQWWQSNLIEIGTLVFDESHLLSNKGSNRASATHLLASAAKRVIMLTGTPVWNRPKGLYTMLSVLNPGAWGSYKKFATRYAAGQMGAYGFEAKGSSNEEEFKKRLSEVLYRRTWADVMSDVPEVVRKVHMVKTTFEQALELDKLAAGVFTFEHTTIGDMARLRRLLGDLKVDSAVEIIQPLKEPVVVWCWHRNVAFKVAQKLKNEGKNVFTVCGNMPQDERDKVLQDWRMYDESVLVITISVGQAGIDLSYAQREVFLEQDWTPATMAQAEARVFSPIRPSRADYVVTNHQIDIKIVAALVNKVKTAMKVGLPAAETSIETIRDALVGELSEVEFYTLLCVV